MVSVDQAYMVGHMKNADGSINNKNVVLSAACEAAELFQCMMSVNQKLEDWQRFNHTLEMHLRSVECEKIHDICQAVYGMKHPSNELEDCIWQGRMNRYACCTIRYLWVCWKSILLQPKCCTNRRRKQLMSKMEYMPVDCLQVPKVLFQIEKYKNLSNTAKILYSLFLDRLKFAVQNGWVDHNGDLFVIYPKSEMKKDLNTTRYGVDQAVQELVKAGKLMRIIPNNGKANHFYISDIYENEKEEKSMMTLDTIMANMPLVEREIIMDKMVKASRDILETIADMGYIDEYETSLTAMEERGYQDELGEMDIDQIQADGYEFGMDLAFGILEENENNPARVLDIQKYVNRQYESCSKKKFMKVLETLVHAMGNDEGFIGDMYACNKKARNYYLDEMIQSFNFVFDEMCHGTGSAANCDFDVEE